MIRAELGCSSPQNGLAATRISIIDQELENLHEAIGELRSNTYSLIDHLSPVLRPVSSRATGAPAAPPHEVALAERISSARQAVREILDMVRDAGERSAL